MISVNLAYNGYVGLSTDTKPIDDVNNGSCFFEMDTQKKYMFNAEGAEWIEQTAEGGGGGGTGAEPFYITIGDDGSDKTFEEVVTAFESGQSVWSKASDQDWYDSMTNIQWNESTSFFRVSFGSNVAEAEAYDGVLYWSEG